ncbi:hypothetical protein GCM10008019_13220 [Deinococcus soli (ex Cha et al. 2016)]|nr:hypothetical protein GCM10008019_13220 [Deinococcus soli (ex Cha et al. 2016)]
MFNALHTDALTAPDTAPFSDRLNECREAARAARLIRIPFVSPTIRNFTGLPAARPEPVSLLLASARTERALQPIQSESV